MYQIKLKIYRISYSEFNIFSIIAVINFLILRYFKYWKMKSPMKNIGKIFWDLLSSEHRLSLKKDDRPNFIYSFGIKMQENCHSEKGFNRKRRYVRNNSVYQQV